MKKIVILGAGGFARETLWVFRDANKEKLEWDVLGFVDENKKKHGTILCDIPILGGFEWFDNNKFKDVLAVCAIGSPQIKKTIIEKAINKNVKFCSIIHPNVKMSKYNEIGEGSIITAGNILTTQITAGKHIIINLDCTIGHDSIIEDYCTILPGCHISGNVHLGKGVDVGTGSVIIQGVSVGEWSVIGAGAVVVKDIPSYVTAVGVPAKVIKHHNDRDNELKHI